MDILRAFERSCIHKIKVGHYEKDTEDELLEIENVINQLKKLKRRLKDKSKEFFNEVEKR